MEKEVKITYVNDYNGEFKAKYTFKGGFFKSFNKLKVGQMVKISERKKGDEYKDLEGKVIGKYAEDHWHFEGAGEVGMSLAKQEELRFLHSLSKENEA